MDNNNPLDQWLKQSFEQESPPDSIRDMAPLWDRVNQSLVAKKKKRAAYWWIFAAAAIGVLITVSIMCIQTIKQPAEENGITENSEIQKETLKEDVNTTDNFEQSEKISTLPNNDKTEEVNTNKADQVSSIDNTSTRPIEGKQINPNKVTVSKEIESKDNLITKDVNIENPAIDNYVWNSTPIAPSILPTLIGFNNESIPALLPSISFDLAKLYPKKDTKMESILDHNPWSIGLNLGLSPSKELLAVASDATNFVHKDYLTLRQKSEKPITTSQFEFYVRKNIGHFYLQSGYSFFKTGYTQNYQYSINEIPITNRFPGTQKDANGKYPLDDQTPYIIDPTPESVSYQGRQITSYAGIPLNFGYTFNLGKAMISPTIGAGINFTQKSGGTTIDYQSLKLTDFNTLFTSVTTSHYSWNIGLVAEYPLSKKLYLQVQPFYNKFLSGGTSVINQTPISYGLNLGLNLKLHNNE